MIHASQKNVIVESKFIEPIRSLGVCVRFHCHDIESAGKLIYFGTCN